MPASGARGRPHPGLRARSLLFRLVGYLPARLRQSVRLNPPCWASCRGSRASATACAATWRCWSCLRSSSERGASAAPFWPETTGAIHARSRLSLPGRGLLGSRMDAPAAGVRLHLRQAALRPPRARPHAPVREHLFAGRDFQDRLARFLENHDEPRAAATFAPEIHRAAAVITFLMPGLRFFHQGQREGSGCGFRPISCEARTSRRTRQRLFLRPSSCVPGRILLSATDSGSCSECVPPGTATRATTR